MASCERCWADSGGDPDRYRELLSERKCTPEEQAGERAEECPACHRKTVHQICNVCMNAECPSNKEISRSG